MKLKSFRISPENLNLIGFIFVPAPEVTKFQFVEKKMYEKQTCVEQPYVSHGPDSRINGSSESGFLVGTEEILVRESKKSLFRNTEVKSRPKVQQVDVISRTTFMSCVTHCMCVHTHTRPFSIYIEANQAALWCEKRDSFAKRLIWQNG